MNLTNSTEVLETPAQVPYKTESNADMHLYYQVLNPIQFFHQNISISFVFHTQNNTAVEVNQTGDGFFPSIFNEDDLQLMDMAITDSNFCHFQFVIKMNVNLFIC